MTTRTLLMMQRRLASDCIMGCVNDNIMTLLNIYYFPYDHINFQNADLTE